METINIYGDNRFEEYSKTREACRGLAMTKEQYLRDPCAASSIPYWKAKSISMPDGMLILHDTRFDERLCRQYADEPYFRLSHDLQGMSAPVLPEGFSLMEASPEDFALHIGKCYTDIGISTEELRRYAARPVYHPALWLAVRNDRTGEIAATGIAELDREIGEGVLEWIQVSKEHRGCGLGSYVVSELLWRMKDIAKFATVSGRCDNPTNPEALYRRCGFKGNDVWHILRSMNDGGSHG